jgi:hypothetical protein
MWQEKAALQALSISHSDDTNEWLMNDLTICVPGRWRTTCLPSRLEVIPAQACAGMTPSYKPAYVTDAIP